MSLKNTAFAVLGAIVMVLVGICIGSNIGPHVTALLRSILALAL
jgi:hypothetical protein